MIDLAHHVKLETDPDSGCRSLVLRIPISTLITSATYSDYFFSCTHAGVNLVIDDPLAFAKATVSALNSEAEDGSTRITRAFDAAYRDAVEWDDNSGVTVYEDIDEGED